jgi:hypothetical protein
MLTFATFLATVLSGQNVAVTSPEFSITGPSRGEQLFPSVTITPAGGLAVWQDNTIDGLRGTGIAGRNLDGALAPQGEAFRINTRLDGEQTAPQVVTLLSGTPLAVWQSRVGARQSIMARLLGSNFSSEIQLNPDTTTNLLKYKTNWYAFTKNKYRKKAFKLKDSIANIREQNSQPVVQPLADGGAVIVYQSVRKHETNSWTLFQTRKWNGTRSITNDILIPKHDLVDWMQDVYFQRVSASGQKVGPEVQANQNAEFNQRSPAVAALPNGNFVVAWIAESRRSFITTNNFQVDVFARLFNSQGQPLGEEFQVNESASLINANPAVAALASGGFTIAWSQQEGVLSRRWDVVSRVFNGNGTAAGSTELINTYRTGDQFAPRIVASGDSQFVVWTSFGQDGSREGVFGRLLSAGVPTGAELSINTNTISRQIHPALGVDSDGRVLAVWSSYVGNSAFDVMGRTFALALPFTPPSNGAVVEASFAAAAASAPVPAPLVFSPAAASVGTIADVAAKSVSAAEAAVRLGLTGSNSRLELHWNTSAGQRYQVEVSTDLRTWTPVGEARLAVRTTDAQTIDSGQAAAFYRVVELR